MDDRRATRLREQFTGAVAGSFAVDVDARGTASCSVCGRTLGPGDRVTTAWRNYDGHTWELLGLYCRDDRIERVAGAMDRRADGQAIVEATLEPTGYHDPLGEFHADVLTLGAVEVLDFSPASAGYD